MGKKVGVRERKKWEKTFLQACSDLLGAASVLDGDLKINEKDSRIFDLVTKFLIDIKEV